MPKLSTTATVTATTTTVVKLKPSIRRQLLTKLRTYQADKAQLEALKARMDKAKADIAKIREDETGLDSIKLEGFTSTKVGGTYHKVNVEKLVSLGCALAWYNEANEEKPKKASERITCPGEKESND